MKNQYDIVFIGCGIATIAALLHLINKKYNGKILVIEAGHDISERRQRDRLHGFGGAGLFSDFKVTISSNINEPIGFSLTDISKFHNEFIKYFINQIECTEYSATQLPRELSTELAKQSIRFINNKVYHLGNRGIDLLRKVRELLQQQPNIEFHFGTIIKQIDDIPPANHIVFAVGRSGFTLMNYLFDTLRINKMRSIADIGIRLEFPQDLLGPIADIGYDPKLYYYTHKTQDKVRTFCANLSNGHVIIENYHNVKLVNGYSPRYFDINSTGLSNVAILVTMDFTEPHENINDWILAVAKMANIISNGSVLVQRLSDLNIGQRSTEKRIKLLPYSITLPEAVPGDLGLVLPKRILDDILEFLLKLDQTIFPGIMGYGVIYGIEAKFYGNKIVYRDNSLTMPAIDSLNNIHIIGDCSGHTRSIYGAALHGIACAQEILEMEK